jgi:hypothetical protein
MFCEVTKVYKIKNQYANILIYKTRVINIQAESFLFNVLKICSL